MPNQNNKLKEIWAIHKYSCNVMNRAGTQICEYNCHNDFKAELIEQIEAAKIKTEPAGHNWNLESGEVKEYRNELTEEELGYNIALSDAIKIIEKL